MKITKLETFANEFVGFVRLTTEDGRQGWGQVRPITQISPRRFCTGRFRHGPWGGIPMIWNA